MFIRQYTKHENGTRVAYWALVQAYRTERGPRQRIVAWLGKLDEAGRLGVRDAATSAQQGDPPSTSPAPAWTSAGAASPNPATTNKSC